MDEIIGAYQENRIIISHVVLNHDKDIKLLRGFEEDSGVKKRYMRNIVIMIGDEFITSNIADTMLFKEELALFNFGDKQNKYFFPSSRIVEKESVSSLSLTLSDGKIIYISKSEAKAMVGLWNMSLQGYSFARLLEFEKEQTLETWTVALKLNGYLQLDILE
jgi:hypothetical protein